MRIVLQRVREAAVSVDGVVTGSIGPGYLLFFGAMQGDTGEQADWLAEKVLKLRLFPGEDGKVNDRNIADTGGKLLAVSQFTLAGRVEKGNRPDFVQAAGPEQAEQLYGQFISRLREAGMPVETGRFGATMQVSLVNDGPCTLLLER